jgi:beta-carotene hydroxylase
MTLLTPLALRHHADRVPLCLALGVGAVQFTTFFLSSRPEITAVIAVSLLLPQVLLSMVVHNHAHCPIFRNRLANRVLNLLLYLETGIMTANFRLHHNCGHHRFYTDPERKRDPSASVRADGSAMGRVEYVVRHFFTYTWWSIRIGRDYPVLLRRLFEDQVAGFGTLVILMALNPLNAVIVFLVPMVVVWLTFINFTYDDHRGLNSTDPYAAAHSKTHRWLNRFIFNNGYHLAHHLKPGVHWSDLPRVHETIRFRIYVPPSRALLNRVFR